MDLWGLVGPVFAWQGLPVSGFRPAESTSDTFVLYHLPAVLAVDDYDACAGPNTPACQSIPRGPRMLLRGGAVHHVDRVRAAVLPRR